MRGLDAGKIDRAGLEAARRKFTPEFINRIDKTIVFRALGEPELRKILTIELETWCSSESSNAAHGVPFVFICHGSSQGLPACSEGTDMKYGARHLKRAIERSAGASAVEPDRHRASLWRRLDPRRL